MARGALAECFGPEIWVKGEIHGLKVHAKSGHIYFDLVEKPSPDTDSYIAKVSCAFFRGAFIKWKTSMNCMGFGPFELNSGLEVKLKARVDLFVKEGRFQLIVQELDPGYTFGAIAKKRAQTIEALQSSGLLRKNKELPLPLIPLNIGLLTSEGSAAYNDFMSIIFQSGFSFNITLFDAHMQGENTIPEVIKGISALDRHPAVDMIVLIRGGGAKTDLFPFDDINLCKAIALCTKPVITGIGHEIDVSVADMAAHTSRVTPTDVARFIVCMADDLWAYLINAHREIEISAERAVRQGHNRLESLAVNLGHIASKSTISALSRMKSIVYALHSKVSRELSSQEKALLRHTKELKGTAIQSIGHELGSLDLFHARIRHTAQALIDARIYNM
ncbi:MAG: exodeoxyribonuclease VII large subunit, partial [Deltaproteobacteria bacterium]|nr:exodeoxyribonuclease VII large subunit [Deltaproteobacteria bacterium]